MLRFGCIRTNTHRQTWCDYVAENPYRCTRIASIYTNKRAHNFISRIREKNTCISILLFYTDVELREKYPKMRKTSEEIHRRRSAKPKASWPRSMRKNEEPLDFPISFPAVYIRVVKLLPRGVSQTRSTLPRCVTRPAVYIFLWSWHFLIITRRVVRLQKCRCGLNGRCTIYTASVRRR